MCRSDHECRWQCVKCKRWLDPKGFARENYWGCHSICNACWINMSIQKHPNFSIQYNLVWADDHFQLGEVYYLA